MIYLGLDLGQSQDPSALAIVERLEPANPHRNLPAWQLSYPAGPNLNPEPLVVRHVERMELDTRYSDVAKRVALVAQCPLLVMLLALQTGCEVRPC